MAHLFFRVSLCLFVAAVAGSPPDDVGLVDADSADASATSSSSPEDGGAVQDPPVIHDHVSRGILGAPPDGFEGGHEEQREEIAAAERMGAGMSPEYTDLVIQEALHYEHEHGVESAVNPISEEAAAEKERRAQGQADRDRRMTEVVSAPGLSNMDSENGTIPLRLGETSATSPTLHSQHLGHKDVDPFSPVPLYNQSAFRADLDALRYANGNYSEKVNSIAQVAMHAVEESSKVFLNFVKDIYMKEAPSGKQSLAMRSGYVSAPYQKDSGAEFKLVNLQGIGCLHHVEETSKVSELEAEHMCNDLGLGCSGYSCNVQGERWECSLCEGVLTKTVHAWREIEKKPFFAMKSPDHMEWDHIVRRTRQWVEKFGAMQRKVEGLLLEESHAMEHRFQTILERRASDPYYNHTNNSHAAWKVALDSAWRQEQFDEANWYAELMKEEISRIDAYYNQVLNKLTRDANMLNDKESSKWNLIHYEELANHSHAFDCWMAIRGVVYDFSYLTPHHPNKHGFIKHCGTDVSQLYEDLGHDGSHLMLIGKRVIGEFVGFPTLSYNDTFNSTDNSSNATDTDTHQNRTDGAVLRYAFLPPAPTDLASSLVAKHRARHGHEQARATWRDFASQIEAEAVQHTRSLPAASLLDMRPRSIGSVRPHRDGTAPKQIVRRAK